MTRRADGESPVARQILLLQVGVVVVLVVTAVALAAWDARRDLRDAAREQATAVARSVADSPFVREEVATSDPTPLLQPFAEEVRIDTGTDFVVIMGTDRIRYTHPDTSQIGREFVGSVGGAPEGKAFTQVYAGTLGPSMRAVVPVTDDGDVVALVAVGIKVDRLDERLREDLPGIGARCGRDPARRTPRRLVDRPAAASPDARDGRARDHPDVRVLPRRPRRGPRGPAAGGLRPQGPAGQRRSGPPARHCRSRWRGSR